MPSKSRSTDQEIKRLLSLAATAEEKENLLELGINIKAPTKLTMIVAALYKKAAGGDLSAIKELFCRLNPEETSEKGVVFIDDIKGSNE